LKSQKNVDETKTGLYDFEKILKQSIAKNRHDIDVADYKSSKIAITDIPKKSKGVIASEFINQGELLVVSKAVSALFKQRFEGTSLKNDLSETLNDSTQHFSNLVYKMEFDPELAKQLYAFYAGLLLT